MGVCTMRTFCGQEVRSVRCGRPNFFVFENFGVFTWTRGEGGLRQCKHFADKEMV